MKMFMGMMLAAVVLCLVTVGCAWFNPPQGGGGGGATAFSGVRVHRTSNWTCDGSDVSWEAEGYDTDSYWAIGDPTLIHLPSDGKYRVTFQAYMAKFGAAVDGYAQANIYHNAAVCLQLIQLAVGDVNDNFVVNGSTVINASAGDTVKAKMYTSPASKQAEGLAFKTFMHVERLGD
jgi:hypothetical protein